MLNCLACLWVTCPAQQKGDFASRRVNSAGHAVACRYMLAALACVPPLWEQLRRS